MTSAETSWWRTATIYQVYVRSFADSNGDGIGDLRGIQSRLDYLVDLGVDGLWLNPCYVSPQRDHGYDVADYTDIDPDYGTLSDAEELIRAAHERGLRVLLDLVPNHCSTEHAWFSAALAAGPGSVERTRFLFRDGKGLDGSEPPNNWESTFSGPAWTRVTEPDGTPGQWYLHSFDTSQPDFNWRNPEVVEYFDNVLRFWFERGADGFRIDVANRLFKHVDLPDVENPITNPHMADQPELHDIFRRWHDIAASYGPERDMIFVGEIWAPSTEVLGSYVRAGELHQAFYFDLLLQIWDAEAFGITLRRAFDTILSSGSHLAWTLNNHDVWRSVSRYGAGITGSEILPGGNDYTDIAAGLRRARAAALLLLAMPGAVYLYQGEELGLPEVQDLPNEVREDPIWFRSNGEIPGRDGCRVPLPWDSTAPTFGFSPADATAKPWLPQPEWFGQYAASEQSKLDDSTLAVYQRALHRRSELFDADMSLHWLDAGDRDDVLAFRRGTATVVTVFGTHSFTPPAEWGEPVVSSAVAEPGTELPGESTTWLR